MSGETYAYEDKQKAAFAEAVRTVIGIASAHERDDAADAAILLSAYHLSAEEIGLTSCGSWAVLFSAAMHWLFEAFKVIEDESPIMTPELIQKFGAEAALWVSKTRGRGGY